MRRFGLIGTPLTHSFSELYFREKFEREGILDAAYSLFPLESIEELPNLIQQTKALCGLNVTIPYKQAVIPYLDELDPAAANVGAVNTIHFVGGKKTGYNTDVIGFRNSLEPLLEPQHSSAIVLGTGGAAKAVAYVLEQLGIEPMFVSRSLSKSIFTYAPFKEEWIASHKLIINTTPVGTFPNVLEKPPLPYEALTADHFLYDLVYNPKETAFLKAGKSAGCKIKNGLEMLELQAEAAWEIWNR